MERRTRVYPAEKPHSNWLSAFLLFLALIVVVSAVFRRPSDAGVSVEPVASATPIPADLPFDETPAVREITLPASQWHALQLGAFEDEASAVSFAQQFIARGAGGYVWHDGRHRVLAAVYPSREDAQQVREQLENRHGIDSYLYTIDLPALRIRLKGMQGQLDILEAAFIHGSDLIAQMQQMSVAMDRREATAEETLLQLSQLSDQLQGVSIRLKQRFASPRPECAEGLIRCFDGLAAFCAEMPSDGSAVALGSSLKKQTLEALDSLKQVYDTLRTT